MRLTSHLTLALVSSRLVSGHAYVWGLSINGKDQGRGDAVPGYIRKVVNNDPIENVRSPDMTCNKNKGPNSKVIDAKSGDKITVTWAHNTRGDEIIADSHKGPVQVYIAPVSSSSTAMPGSGAVWVKIASDGYSGQWATDKLREKKGQHSFTIPAQLAPGDYLIRPEIIALHEASRQGGAQLYMACVQLRVAGNGSKEFSAGISFPGTYSTTDPGILFNIYDKPMKKYSPPGGPVQML